MPTEYMVKPGDCITSIAEQHGLFWDTLWNDPANANLRELRQDPNTLVPGDVVVILDKRVKEVSVGTDQRHTFRRKGIPAMCRLQLYDGDEYRSTQSYTLTIDGIRQTGVTDAEGVLKVFIKADAAKGRLVIGPDEAVYELQFGYLEPVTTVAGQKARLTNLGFDAGDPKTAPDEQMKSAVLAFQTRFGLKETGEADEATQTKLLKLHDEVSDLPAEETTHDEEAPVPNDQEEFDY